MSQIRFGTDGWRAVIGEGFTFPAVESVARAHARVLKREGKKRVLVGYDRRFLSEAFARRVADAFKEEGLEVKLAGSACTTPMVSFGVKYLGYDGGVMITASHNPPEYNGYKIKDETGGPAPEELVKQVEEELKRLPKERPASYEHELQELRRPYVKKLRELMPLELFNERELLLVHDAMYGTSAGLLEFILKDTKVTVAGIRQHRDALFGGHPPEPVEKYVKITQEKVRALNAFMGVVNDGDGDRLALVDERGSFVNTQLVYALLMLHVLKNKKMRGTVVKTVSTSYLADRIARAYGVKLIEVPVGFKHVNRVIRSGEPVVFGGEESGGFGFPHYLPERDGTFSALMILEFLLLEDRSLSAAVNELLKNFGPAHYGRVDLRVEPEAKERIKSLKANPPEKLGPYAVKEVRTADGLKLVFDDDAWLLMRPSGTEPLVRVYAESPSAEQTEKLLELGLKLLK
ncbi:MAG: phosphoglucomutase/phosphomannomutase family protein [Aquificae bacterium]|nr:phosphoglucomutase/phosphomannomutase family protein [Aquificota bacterium]